MLMDSGFLGAILVCRKSNPGGEHGNRVRSVLIEGVLKDAVGREGGAVIRKFWKPPVDEGRLTEGVR